MFLKGITKSGCGATDMVAKDFLWRRRSSSMATSSSLSPGQTWSLDLFADFPSTTNNVKPAQGGATTRHRHGPGIEDERAS
jgi:hypothetical protein